MEWINNENNFPAIMINNSGDFTIAKNKDIYFLNTEYGFRLATENESRKLYTKIEKNGKRE